MERMLETIGEMEDRTTNDLAVIDRLSTQVDLLLSKAKTDEAMKQMKKKTDKDQTHEVTQLNKDLKNKQKAIDNLKSIAQTTDHRVKSLESSLKETRKTLIEESKKHHTAVEKNQELTAEKEDLESKLAKANKALLDMNDTLLNQKIQLSTLNVEKRHQGAPSPDTQEAKVNEIESLKEKIEELSQDKQELQKELKKQLGNSNDSPHSDNEEEEQETKEEEPAKRIIVIAYSNRKYIKNQLTNTEKINYEFIENIYTTAQLMEKVTELVENHQPNTHYMILEGTNDLRDGKPTRQTYENIKGSVIKLRKSTGAIVQLLQIPPHKDAKIDWVIDWVNEKLAKLPKNDAGIIYTTVDLKVHNKPMSSLFINKEHKFHINEKTAKLYVEEIEKTWKTQQQLHEMTTDACLAGYIIGRGGRTINRIKMMSQCEVAVVNIGMESKITARGTEQNVTKAIKEITMILQQTLDETDSDNQSNKKKRARSKSAESTKPGSTIKKQRPNEQNRRETRDDRESQRNQERYHRESNRRQRDDHRGRSRERRDRDDRRDRSHSRRDRSHSRRDRSHSRRDRSHHKQSTHRSHRQ